jgi:hypothetical protein
MSPKQFGFYVMAHPDSLLVTARNKMGSGKKVVINQNYTGKIVESTWLSLDSQSIQRNEALIAAAWKGQFGGKIAEKTDKGWVFKDVSVSVVEEFVARFEVHARFTGRRSAAIAYLQAIEKQFPYADVLLISKEGAEVDDAAYRLGPQERAHQDSTSSIWHAAQNRVKRLQTSTTAQYETSRCLCFMCSQYHTREQRITQKNLSSLPPSDLASRQVYTTRKSKL